MNRLPFEIERRRFRREDHAELAGGEMVRCLAAAPSRVLASDALFRGTHEIGIEHAGALYRLKITRQGKLILNK